MKKDKHTNNRQEVNLKLFFRKVFKHKLFFLLSICLCVASALAYIYLATPKYEVSTSILIDPFGSNRVLGESKYVDGGVSLIEMEKNLYNEIGIIKSYSLVRKTLEDLNFDVSYYASVWPKKKEHFGYFPFEVDLIKTSSQLYNAPFEVEIIDNEKYKLSIDTDEFKVSNPSNGSAREMKRSFYFSKIFSFGEKVNHDYFSFILRKPDYRVNPGDIEGELSFEIHDLNGVANNYLSNIAVDNIDIQASIFKIASYGAVVDKEVRFLKKLTENYISEKLASRSKIATSKEAFIRNQLAIVTDSLLKVELDLEMFKKDRNAVDLGATASNALDLTQNLSVDKAKIELDIKYYNSLIKYVKSNKNSDDFVIPTAIGIEDPLINGNIVELKRLYDLRAKKKFYVTSNNQEMSILNKQIEEATGLLLDNLRAAIRSGEFALQGVNAQLDDYKGLISDLPTQEKQLLNIERQSTLYENLFNYLSQELAKTGIAGAENTSDTRVLDEARMVGSGPVEPQKMLLLALAGILGLLIPMAWIVIFSPNDTIENVDQIMANTELPVIASIVHHDEKARKARADISRWKLKESFRDLSTNLKLFSSEDERVIGITSIMPEEGKTYSSINLGIAFAEAGKKTLIIDTDLRRPSLVRGFQNKDSKGLSNYLQGDITVINEIIYSHEKLGNLDFIPTSVVKSNVHGLLAGHKMKSLVLELKEKYDYVILDTPAVGLVSDFLHLWDLIDVNLFVVRRKKAKVRFLEDIESLIPEGKEKKNYIIFNDAPIEDHKYGYAQKYGMNEEKQLVYSYLSV